MQKEILIKQLLTKENFTLEKKEGILYVNGISIRKLREEFTKLLFITVFHLKLFKKNIEQQLSLFFQDKQYIRFQQEETNATEEEDEEDLFEELNDNEEEQQTMDADEFDERCNKIPSQLSKQTLYQFLNFCQPNIVNISYFGNLIKQYERIITQMSRKQFQKIQVLSPFFIQERVPLIELNGTLECLKNYNILNCGSKDCSGYGHLKDTKSDELFDERDNDLLNAVGNIRIDTVLVNVDIQLKCFHRNEQILAEEETTEAGDYVLNIRSLSNIKFKRIWIEQYHFLASNRNRREINIYQDQYLEVISITTHVLSQVNVIQEDNRILRLLALIHYNSRQMTPIKDIINKLDQIKFCEISISSDYLQYKQTDCRELINLDYFLNMYAAPNIQQNIEEQMRLINHKYVNILQTFAFCKLFDSQLSSFRCLYDLYESVVC